MANFVSGIMGLVILLVLIANLFIPTVLDTNTSTWNASEVSLWGILTLVAIVGVAYSTLSVFGIV